MPPPTWHINKYRRAKRLIGGLRTLIQKRRQGNVTYMEECLRDLEVLAVTVDEIRS